VSKKSPPSARRLICRKRLGYAAKNRISRQVVFDDLFTDAVGDVVRPLARPETKAIGSTQITPGLATGALTSSSNSPQPAAGGRPAAGTTD
jgi:hypothetical protein